MEVIEVSQLLNKDKSEYPSDYIFDVYKGCDLGCIYCDGHSSCYRNSNFENVKIKKDVLTELAHELKGKRRKSIISIGLLSDPYVNIEKEVELTRECLKMILHYGFGVIIHTKSDLVLRDLDILKEIHEKNCVIVNVCITSNDELSKKIEKNVCSSNSRFEIIRKCKEAGLISGVNMNPVLPYISDSKDDLIQLIEKARDVNADYILSDMKITLRDKQRDSYYQCLDQIFPGLSYQYRRIYNNRYHCEIKSWKENYEYLKTKCIQYDMLYQVDDLNLLVQNHKKEYCQISLFE